jgi:hypothetical protein
MQRPISENKYEIYNNQEKAQALEGILSSGLKSHNPLKHICFSTAKRFSRQVSLFAPLLHTINP